MSFKKVNVAVQLLPFTEKSKVYPIVDKAIEVIKSSGIKHVVTPFETVLEGDYDAIMDVVKKIQEAAFDAGAENILVNLKIQNSKLADALIEDKTGKYH